MPENQQNIKTIPLFKQEGEVKAIFDSFRKERPKIMKIK